MSRPTGALRSAIARAAIVLVEEHEGVPYGATFSELAARAQVGFAAAKATVYNMFKAGALDCVGEIKDPSSRRPVKIFRPSATLLAEFGVVATAATQPRDHLLALTQVIQTWGRPRS